MSTTEELCAAAERLGAKLHDLQAVLHLRPTEDDGAACRAVDSLSEGSKGLVFEDGAIQSAVDESLFAVCEKGFGPYRSVAVSSTGSSSPTPGQSPVRVPIRAHRDASSNSRLSSARATPLRAPDRHATSHVSETRSNTASKANKGEREVPQPPEKRFFANGKQGRPRRESSRVTGTSDEASNSADHANRRTTRTTASSPAPRTTPLASILAFAHGKESSLADIRNCPEKEAFRIRTSVATIKGCDDFRSFDLFAYVKALCDAHLNAQKDMVCKNETRFGEEIDSLSVGLTHEEWKENLRRFSKIKLTRAHGCESVPPIIGQTKDLVQFILRLLESMLSFNDTMAHRFIESWYESGLPHQVAELTVGTLSIWVQANRESSSSGGQSELVEWCVRLMTDFVVYELSPVSSIKQANQIRSATLFFAALGKGKVASLPSVIRNCFLYVSSHNAAVSKECKLSLCELAQVCVIRCTSSRPSDVMQKKLSKELELTSPQVLADLVALDAFWTIVVQSVGHHIRKQPKPSDACFEIAFLASLVRQPAAMRALLEQQTKCKRLLLAALTRILELMSRDMLACFVEVECNRDSYPGLYTSVDFAGTLMSSAVVQRELLSTDSGTKDLYLELMEGLIMRAARLVSVSYDINACMEYAKQGLLGQTCPDAAESSDVADDSEGSRSLSRKGDTEISQAHRKVAQLRALAFTASLIGSMSKSVEDGSRDMSQMNTLKALLSARFSSTRSQMRLWNAVFTIQRGLERKVNEELLLSESERNNFTIVAEGIRKYVVNDQKEQETDVSNRGFVADPLTPSLHTGTITQNASFPKVTEVLELQHAVCSRKGYEDLDDNYDLILFLRDMYTDHGQQLLARYDPKSEYTSRWIRLQRKNVFVEGARDLLDKEDKTVGQRCSCVPGNPKEKGDRAENRIACSNDLCENRLMKIECVPGKCGAGSYCQNQRMQNLEYAKFKMVAFPGKGVGIVADENIEEGALIGEYQGEVISMATYEKRLQEYEGERHFYFMTLTSKLVIDASRKSQATRFLNHSCEPNSETQKWNADGEPRVGIYARQKIVKGEEITFDYGARSIAKYSAPCICGAEACRGRLAARNEKQERTGSPHGTAVPLPGIVQSKNDVESQGPHRKKIRLTDEDRRMAIVRDKIASGEAALKQAKALGELIVSKERRTLCDFAALPVPSQQKVQRWKQSLQMHIPIFGDTEKPPTSANSDPSLFRIPRKGPGSGTLLSDAAQNRGMEGVEGTAINADKSGGRAGITSSPFPSDSEIFKIPRRRPTSARAADEVESRDEEDRHSDGKQSGRMQAVSDVIKDTSVFVRASRKPISRGSFLPTSTRLKKQPVKPKVARRQKTRATDSDDDSMGDYSTASEAEPVLEEPPVSPSRLPDGSGACSDDEFVAAPPVETMQRHREEGKFDEKWKPGRNPNDRDYHVNKSRSNERIRMGREGHSDARPFWKRGSALDSTLNDSGSWVRHEGAYRSISPKRTTGPGQLARAYERVDAGASRSFSPIGMTPRGRQELIHDQERPGHRESFRRTPPGQRHNRRNTHFGQGNSLQPRRTGSPPVKRSFPAARGNPHEYDVETKASSPGKFRRAGGERHDWKPRRESWVPRTSARADERGRAYDQFGSLEGRGRVDWGLSRRNEMAVERRTNVPGDDRKPKDLRSLLGKRSR